MTAVTETQQAPPAAGRPSRTRLYLAIAAAAALVAGAFIALVVMLNGQSGQISTLQHQVATAQSQAAAAQAKASQATSAAQSAGKTQAAADHANLGVCVSTTYNYSGSVSWVQSVSVTSPVLTNGVASCPSGQFTPVSPQKAPGS